MITGTPHEVSAGPEGWLVAQHGNGFVGSAWTIGFDYRCPGRVVALDIDRQKISAMRDRGIPAFHVDNVEAYRHVPHHSFSVPTPSANTADGELAAPYDLSYNKTALTSFGQRVLRNSRTWMTVWLRSTFMPGTTQDVLIPILEETSGKRVGVDFDVIYYPEFLREVDALPDSLRPPVIAYAATSDRGAETFEQVLKCLKAPFLRHDSLELAELHKLGNNLLNGLGISFFHWLMVMMVDGIAKGRPPALDGVLRVWSGIRQTSFFKTEPVYGTQFKGPFGGNCLPKDIKALGQLARDLGLSSIMPDAALLINQFMEQNFDRLSAILTADRRPHAEQAPVQLREQSRIGRADTSPRRLEGQPAEEVLLGKGRHESSGSRATPHHNGNGHLVSTGGGTHESDGHQNGVESGGSFGRRHD